MNENMNENQATIDLHVAAAAVVANTATEPGR